MRGIRSNRLADGVKKKVMCNNKSCGDHVNDRFAMCEKLTKCVDRSAATPSLDICPFAKLEEGSRKRVPFSLSLRSFAIFNVCVF